jgi:Family of unknown function (DUF6159)/Protein of unknown function (DUF2510)
MAMMGGRNWAATLLAAPACRDCVRYHDVMSMELTPAAWYPDPSDGGYLRYWDGSAWTEHRTPAMGTPSQGSAPSGKQLLRASLGLFRQNRNMIWLPVLSGVVSAVAFLGISGVVAVPLWRAYGLSPWEVLYLLPAIMVTSFIGVYFNVALVFAANEQIEGRGITVRQALGMAWSRRRVVFSWALLSAVVGVMIQTVESRLGVFGRLLGMLGGLAWAVATFLVVPVVAFEDIGPIEALKRSSHLMKTTFGTVARGALRFGLLFIGWSLLAVAIIITGVVVALAGTPVLGVPIATVGVIGFFVVLMYLAAAGMYMRTILYRYATHKPLPDLGLDLSGAFRR